VSTSTPPSNSKAASDSFAGGLAARWQPAQAAGDHQVDDQIGAVVQPQHDALAQPLHADHAAPLGLPDRRQCRAQHEGVEHSQAAQHLALQLGLQALDVDGDVRQFRHRALRAGATAGAG
jgi:hypothetical protein